MPLQPGCFPSAKKLVSASEGRGAEGEDGYFEAGVAELAIFHVHCRSCWAAERVAWRSSVFYVSRS